MGNRLIIAFAITAVVVVAGFIGYRAMFGSDSSPTETRSSDRERGADEPRSVDAAAPAEPEFAVKVTAVSGVVERQTADSSWIAVNEGDELSFDSIIRTGADGLLTLDVGGVAEVEVDASSQISVPALTRTVKRVQLGEGRLSARVPSGSDGSFGVSVRGGDAVAQTSEGEFAVLSGGEGEMTVAATKGSVTLTSHDESVVLAEGELSIAERNVAPTAPRPIPPSLYLKVLKPKRRVQRSKQLDVAGTTEPGAVISVNGVRVAVGPNGEFSTVVTLDEGKNDVRVGTRDVTGRSKDDKIKVTVDSKGPTVGGEVKWGD